MATNVTQVTDSMIKGRNRILRARVFFGTPVVLASLGGLLVAFLADTFLMKELFWPGFVIGATAGVVAFLAMKHRFIVKNNTTGMLVTLDQLQSLLGKTPHVCYGPGTHFSLPWEARFAQNNIPVEEAAEDLTFTALCKDGTITGKGSIRLRPDFENPINYLSGVAAVGKDLQDLVVTFITDWFANQKMESAIKMKVKLNTALRKKFVENEKNTSGRSDFEERFGVRLGDVTVSELLMSDEVQRTRSALNEGRVIAEGTAILLGFETVVEMMAAVGKTITQEDIDRARRDFRIISGNMDSATVNRVELDIRGLSPEAAAAISAMAQNPNAAAVLKRLSGGKKDPAKNVKKGK